MMKEMKTSRPAKASGGSVDEFMTGLKHPLKDEIQAARGIL